jgi:hypothetical protein
MAAPCGGSCMGREDGTVEALLRLQTVSDARNRPNYLD